ncbi:MAG: maltotransferase domain-containing protein, partial [Candidatus Methylomirabilales bacterium]
MESRSRPPRVVIEAVRPQVDGGRFAIKRIAGDRVVVEADVFADGQDLISCVLKYRPEQEPEWAEGPTEHIGNDRWRGSFVAGDPGLHRYSLEAWIDHFGSWRRDLAKKLDAGMDVWVDVLVGAELAERAATAASGADAEELRGWATRLRDPSEPALAAALSEELALLMGRHPDRSFAATSREFPLVVDRERARFGAWYEIFPRSASADPSRPGTLADCEEHIPYLAAMGFDVLYLPPIHPTGATHRKGKNNNPSAGPDDPGSPWAIGSEAGGHKAIDPLLGDLGDFDRLVKAASEAGIEVALDLAYQCSPDHPYVSEHPDWFRRRPDGTTRSAENPPKKYEDIYPLDFDTEAWRELWEELRSVVEFWMDHGVRIFRVDNPHTKPIPFWTWMIAEVQAVHPDVIFLAEAFTRPRVMQALAKVGFTQSYTYFTWRNFKQELVDYLTELTRGEMAEYFRGNFFTNTPDILPPILQQG